MEKDERSLLATLQLLRSLHETELFEFELGFPEIDTWEACFASPKDGDNYVWLEAAHIRLMYPGKRIQEVKKRLFFPGPHDFLKELHSLVTSWTEERMQLREWLASDDAIEDEQTENVQSHLACLEDWLSEIGGSCPFRLISSGEGENEDEIFDSHLPLYEDLSVSTRIRLLSALARYALFGNQMVIEALHEGNEVAEIARNEPMGWDKKGNAYYWFQDIAPYRIYRESYPPKEKPSKPKSKKSKTKGKSGKGGAKETKAGGKDKASKSATKKGSDKSNSKQKSDASTAKGKREPSKATPSSKSKSSSTKEEKKAKISPSKSDKKKDKSSVEKKDDKKKNAKKVASKPSVIAEKKEPKEEEIRFTSSGRVIRLPPPIQTFTQPPPKRTKAEKSNEESSESEESEDESEDEPKVKRVKAVKKGSAAESPSSDSDNEDDDDKSANDKTRDKKSKTAQSNKKATPKKPPKKEDSKPTTGGKGKKGNSNANAKGMKSDGKGQSKTSEKKAKSTAKDNASSKKASKKVSDTSDSESESSSEEDLGEFRRDVGWETVKEFECVCKDKESLEKFLKSLVSANEDAELIYAVRRIVKWADEVHEDIKTALEAASKNRHKAIMKYQLELAYHEAERQRDANNLAFRNADPNAPVLSLPFQLRRSGRVTKPTQAAIMSKHFGNAQDASDSESESSDSEDEQQQQKKREQQESPATRRRNRYLRRHGLVESNDGSSVPDQSEGARSENPGYNDESDHEDYESQQKLETTSTTFEKSDSASSAIVSEHAHVSENAPVETNKSHSEVMTSKPDDPREIDEAESHNSAKLNDTEREVPQQSETTTAVKPGSPSSREATEMDFPQAAVVMASKEEPFHEGDQALPGAAIPGSNDLQPVEKKLAQVESQVASEADQPQRQDVV